MINLDRLEKLESKTSYSEPKKEDQKDWNPFLNYNNNHYKN